MRLCKLLFCLCLSGFQALFASEILEIQVSAQTHTLSQKDLLKNPNLQTVTVAADPAYAGKSMTYSAIPLVLLLKSYGIQEADALQFTSRDGFVSLFSAKEVLHPQDPAQAFLAIESPEHQWPALASPATDTAGAFYLIWQHPSSVPIGKEKWPYQVIGIEVKAPLASRFPSIFPDAKLSDLDPVQKGFQFFVQNCFVCHSLNQEGESHVGPDLNFPMSVTAYWEPSTLRKFIRNPQSVRSWSQGKMRGFDEKEMSESQLDQVIAYLKHMAQQK